MALTIKQMAGKSAVSQLVRDRLESMAFFTIEGARQRVQREFPHHIVAFHGEEFVVSTRDRSFVVASFRKFLQPSVR